MFGHLDEPVLVNQIVCAGLDIQRGAMAVIDSGLSGQLPAGSESINTFLSSLAWRDRADGCISCTEWAGGLRNLRNLIQESRNLFGKSADHLT